MPGILLALFTGILWAAVGVIISRVTSKGLHFCIFFAAGTLLATLLNLAVAFGFAASRGASLPPFMPAAGWLIAAGLINPLGMIFMNRAMRGGHHGIVWAISQSAMVIPFLFAILYWGNPVNGWGWAGMAAMLAGIGLMTRAMPAGTAQTPDRAWIILTLGAFAVIGAAQVLMDWPSHLAGVRDLPGFRPAVMFAANIPLYAVVAVARRERPGRPEISHALAWSALALVSTLTLFKAMDVAAAGGVSAAVFPLVVGVCIAAFSLYSRIRLGEPYTMGGRAGIVLCLGGIAGIAIGNLTVKP